MKKILEEKKEAIISIIIVIVAIISFVVRVNQVEEENKSTYDSDWRYHHYSQSYNNYSNDIDSKISQLDNNKSPSNSVDDPYGKEFYDDADDFADDNAAEFGDGDEDDGWDDAYDYYEEENKR